MTINTIKHKYAELVSLTELFILREYPLKTRLDSYPSHHAFFQCLMPVKTSEVGLQEKPLQTRTPAVKHAMATPPSPNPNPLPFPGPTPIPSPDPQPLPSKPGPITPSPDPIPEVPSPTPSPPELIDHKKKSSSVSSFLTLEPLQPASAKNEEQGFKQIFKQLFPDYPLSEIIPDDKLAKRIMNSWSQNSHIPPIVILSFSDQEKHLTLLKNIAKAISIRFVPAQVMSGLKIEKEKKWETLLHSRSLRLVIASDYGLYLQPELMKHYRETPKQAKYFLLQTPLLLLSDLDLYLKQPQLKSLLWRAICNEAALKQA